MTIVARNVAVFEPSKEFRAASTDLQQMAIEELRTDSMMAHLIASLEKCRDIAVQRL